MAEIRRTLHRGRSTSAFRYTLDRLVPSVEFTPLRITVLYAMLGFSALYVSDVLLVRLVDDAAVLQQLQALKGGAEIVLTAGLIFVLTRRSRRTLREKNDHLLTQHEQLQVLHRVLRHNLRNDMNVVVGNAELVCDDLDEQATRRCERIVEKSNDVIDYVETAGKIDRLTDDGTETVEVDLSREVASVVEDARTDPTVAGDGADVDLRTSVPAETVVEVNRLLGEALAELVTNALEHNDAANPSVSVVVDEDAPPRHMVDVRVEDNGPGIPEMEHRALDANGPDDLRHASGLGLWFVYWTVQLSGGTLHVDDREPRGTVVTLRLPRAFGDVWELPRLQTALP